MDTFILSGHTGFKIVDMSNAIGRAQIAHVNIAPEHVVSVNKMRSYVSSKVEALQYNTKRRGSVARYICHSMPTAAYHYVAPTAENVVY